MKICWPIGAIALLSFCPLAVQANPDKLSECLTLANTLQGAAGNLQPTGDLNTALAVTGRLQQNLRGLQLRDRQLQSFQQRYLAFFATAETLLNQGRTTGNEDTLRTLIGTAQQHNLTGSTLAQEVVEYCLKP
ncbi:MAG TPA: hypothetical protein DCQ32_03665 [Cyanobacteria bacterium UBA8156]|jgi:hypothetical protein|nr:hypothetical protein [Cyanobacteria bacterium UBA8156]